jgi:hypothetical protein
MNIASYEECSKKSINKVLILRAKMERGGAENHILELSKCLKEEGVQVDLATSSYQESKSLDSPFSHVYLLPFFPSTIINLIISISKLIRIVRKGNYQIVHSHHRFTSIVGKIVSVLTGVPW